MKNNPDATLLELERVFAKVRTSPRQQKFDRNGYKCPDDSPLGQLTYFSQALLSGALPYPDTLLFLAKAISRYLSEEGRISLDEAFQLKSIPGIGNPAAQSAKRNQTNIQLFEMACLRVKEEGLSIVAASNRVSKYTPSKATSLERAYRRRKNGHSVGETYENAIRNALRDGTMKP